MLTILLRRAAVGLTCPCLLTLSACIPTPFNVGLPTDCFVLDGRYVAFAVSEALAGDLNQDGDSLDRVVHVYDSVSGTIVNLGLALADGKPLAVDNGVVLFLVDEEQQDQDLNSDLDQFDDVLHEYDTQTGQTINHELPVVSFESDQFHEGLAAMLVEEEQFDLNGDLDTNDTVVFFLNETNLFPASLGLACDPAFPPVSAHGRIAVAVPEVDQGEDLNSDADVNDSVLFVVDFPSPITNTGLAVDAASLLLGEELLLFSVPEASQDADLNGDLDMSDSVVHIYDTQTRVWTNVGLADNDSLYAVDGRTAAFGVFEPDQFNQDLNQDSDSLDVVLHVRRFGTTSNLSQAIQDSTRRDPPRAQVAGDLVSFEVSEIDQDTTDLNQDSDTVDQVQHVFQPSTGITTNLGIAVSEHIVTGSLVALMALEESSIDFNEDGDQEDTVLILFEVASGSETNLGLAVDDVDADNDSVAFSVLETAQDGTDLNGDSDATDSVLFVWDPMMATPMNTGLAGPGGDAGMIRGQLWAFLVSEVAQGADLDGDRQQASNVLHVLAY